MTLLKRTGWILAIALATGLAVGAQSQQPAPKPEEKKPVKKKKVWTQDDVAGLRTAAEECRDKKAAEEAAAKAAAAETVGKPGSPEEPEKEPLIDPISGKPYLDPNSTEAMEEQVKKWEEEYVRTEGLLNEARSKQALAENTSDWESLKTEIEIYQVNLADMQRRVDELKAKLAAAKAPKQEGAGAAPQTPPPAQPPPSL